MLLGLPNPSPPCACVCTQVLALVRTGTDEPGKGGKPGDAAQNQGGKGQGPAGAAAGAQQQAQAGPVRRPPSALGSTVGRPGSTGGPEEQDAGVEQYAVLASAVFNLQLSVAAAVPRHYIIDQTK